MSVSKDITVRFPLTDGDGDFPHQSQFSKTELSDLRTCLSLTVCWEPEQMEDNQDAKIVRLEILYDGITRIEEEDYGYWFEDDELYGYPAPIIRFELDKKVDIDDFRRSIFTSFFKLTSALIIKEEDEFFIAEDHNGYTSVVDNDEREELIEYLTDHDAFCGKIFSFPAGLQEYGYVIPGEDFILKALSPK